MRVYCKVKTCANWEDGHCINTTLPGINAIHIDEDARCTCYVPMPVIIEDDEAGVEDR